LICSFLPPFHTSEPQTSATLAAGHRKKSTRNFIAHVTIAFSNESSCEVEFLLKIRIFFLVSNSNDNGTVEMSDVHLILSPPAICGGANRTAKT